MNICDIRECTGCMACFNICAKNAINLNLKEGFLYPVVNHDKCISCGKCKSVCPSVQSVNKSRPIDNIAYAAINKKKDIRDSSSSGGIFYTLAKNILENEGIVYGAAWSDDLRVTHIRVDKIEYLSLLQGSKYVQSDIGRIYCSVKNDLELDRSVLFSGVPCQIAGLKIFLGKEYQNLTTCEVLCHGAASPEIFNKHIEYINKKFNSRVKSVNFRFKTEQKCQNIKYRLQNEEDILLEEPMEDFYYYGFQSGILLRESCFNCKYVGLQRCADITLADFWGLEKEALTLPDNLSYPSLIFVNSEKGRNILKKNEKQWLISKRTIDEAIWGNLSLRRAVPFNKRKKYFFKNYYKYGYEKAANKYLKIHYNVKDIIKKILGKRATSVLIKVLKR